MSRLATMNATGLSTAAPGTRYGRCRSGTCPRNAPIDSGAPAYISTDAPVTRPTSECQLGNGSRKTRPREVGVGEENHIAPRRQHSGAHAVAFAAVAGVLEQAQFYRAAIIRQALNR